MTNSLLGLANIVRIHAADHASHLAAYLKNIPPEVDRSWRGVELYDKHNFMAQITGQDAWEPSSVELSDAQRAIHRDLKDIERLDEVFTKVDEGLLKLGRILEDVVQGVYFANEGEASL